MAKIRITKEPEVRKNEIIAAAEELFFTKGFEDTTVSDIVNKVGVAQGLFYYYFKSKTEVLDAVIECFGDNSISEFRLIANDEQLTAIQKLNNMFSSVLLTTFQREKIVHYMHQASNELLHYRLTHKFLDEMISIFVKIIEQGVREKVFDVSHPLETAEVLLTGIGYMPSIFKILPSDTEQFVNKLRAGFSVIEKALGAPKGSLRIDGLHNERPG